MKGERAEAANDNNPEAILDTLLTPEQIADRIRAATGVNMTARTIWEKARRIGVSKKLGRSPLISANDIPALLQEENRRWPTSSNEENSTTIISPMRTVSSGKEALALLQKSRRKRKQMRT